jgi:hypothetical protein
MLILQKFAKNRVVALEAGAASYRIAIESLYTLEPLIQCTQHFLNL